MRTVCDLHAWPHTVDLDVGEHYELPRSLAPEPEHRTVEVLGLEHRYEPDRFVDENSRRRTLAEATVRIDVDGEVREIRHRPYQLPVEVRGLRLYVETTRRWANDAEYAALSDVSHDVRLSIAPAGEPWGPTAVRFPVADYRWGSSSYRNTWSALVPYNRLYYHRGEDFGAIPDRLDVLAPFDGEITRSPLPDGDGASNAVVVARENGEAARLAHMNAETIVVREGDVVEAGDTIGKTGCTWDGRRSQIHDPHLHVGFERNNARVSPYPTLVEAYLRDFPDPVLPVAGGYRFALPGDEVRLDGSRSVAGPGREIDTYRWRLHDGTVSTGSVASLTADEPGLYAEELIVETDDGSTDRDFLQLRVYDPYDPDPAPYGWVYHHPVRGVEPGDEVLFWNRLRYDGPVHVAFGDGTETTVDGDGELTHAYDGPGTYVVAFEGGDPAREPVTVKIRTVVEDRSHRG